MIVYNYPLIDWCPTRLHRCSITLSCLSFFLARYPNISAWNAMIDLATFVSLWSSILPRAPGLKNIYMKKLKTKNKLSIGYDFTAFSSHVVIQLKKNVLNIFPKDSMGRQCVLCMKAKERGNQVSF